jgi:hypothetical protein
MTNKNMRVLGLILSSILMGWFGPAAFAQNSSVDASQVAQVKTIAEGAALLKSWSDKTRAGVGNMIVQEGAVSKEIEAGYARLQKSCELAAALKDNTVKIDAARINANITQFDERLAKVVSARQEVLAKAQSLVNNLEANAPANCGLFSGDTLPCQTYKYKKETAQYLLVSANTYYDILTKRYQLYKAIALKSREQCIRPEFLAKLASADDEYLVVYERKSTQVFLRLLEAVQGAFINQATQ